MSRLLIKFSVWRVAKGPNCDWPLALCDFRTLNAHNDVEKCDIVDRTSVGECLEVYHSPGQTWYFLDNQQTDEVIVFRNCATEPASLPCKEPLRFLSMLDRITDPVCSCCACFLQPTEEGYYLGCATREHRSKGCLLFRISCPTVATSPSSQYYFFQVRVHISQHSM